MNKNISFLVIASLATALVLPHVGNAEAANIASVEDGRKQLSPKAFGDKTKYAMCSDQPCFKKIDTIKKNEKSVKELWNEQQLTKALSKYVKPIRN